MSGIKVLHLAYVHHKDDVRVVRKEICTLYNSGYEMYYASHEKVPGETPEYVTFFPIKTNRKYIFENYFIDKKLRNEYFEIIDRINPDVVHIHEYGISYLVKAIKRRNSQINVIYDVHEDNIHYSYEKDIKRYGKLFAKILVKMRGYKEHEACRNADYVITAVKGIYDNLCRYSRRIVEIRNYPIVNLSEQYEYGKRDWSICYSGTISPNRCLETAIEACERIGIRLEMAGQANQDYLELLMEKYADSYNKNWFYLGRLNFEEVRELYKRSLVGICLLEESIQMRLALPIKLFEYMETGLPVIATNLPAISEILLESEAGVLLDNNEVDTCEEALKIILNDSEKTRELSKKGFLSVREKYNWKSEGEKLIKAYQEII